MFPICQTTAIVYGLTATTAIILVFAIHWRRANGRGLAILILVAATTADLMAAPHVAPVALTFAYAILLFELGHRVGWWWLWFAPAIVAAILSIG